MAELIQAGEFATEGERLTALTLRDGLPDDWVVTTNKLLPLRDGRNFEIDVIIVARRHVFVIDEKAWGGKITGNAQSWKCADGRFEHNPLNKIAMIAKAVAGDIRQRLPRPPVGYFVSSAVIFSNPSAQLQIDDPRQHDEILRLDLACEHLMRLDAHGSVDLRPHRDALRKVFAGFDARPTVPREIPPYQIDEVEPARPGVQIFAASFNHQRYHLMVYDLGADPFLRTQRKTWFTREFEALRALQETGTVAQAETPIVWGEAQLVIPVMLPAGKALSAVPFPVDRDTLLADLQLAESAFKGLQQIHQRQVLHRALNPAAITIASQKPVKVVFSGFHAARMGDHSIAASLDLLKLQDPYAAPALAAGYGEATASTDCFSLGLIFLERLSATTVDQLRIGKHVEWPNLLKRWSGLPQPPLERLQNLFQLLLQPKAAPEAVTAERAANELAQVMRLLQQETGQFQEQFFDQRYKVVRKLGQGAMARTFLVIDDLFPDLGVFAVKQFLNPASVSDQARAEFLSLQKLRSRHVPYIHDIYPQTSDVHLKMEYIPGSTLMELESRFPLAPATWWEWARQLLDALAELEHRQLLHRDIKPANLMIHEEENRLVLIDFGFAIPREAAGGAAGTLIYQPPEAQQSTTPPADSDRYAAAVVLFRMLTGELPFEEADRQRPRTRASLAHLGLQQQRIAEALLAAVQPQPDKRPANLGEWRQRIERAMLALPDVEVIEQAFLVNPWATAIRGLYRNSQTGNADNRGLDSAFVRQTYVATRLDTVLLPTLLEQRPRAVFLCGNPGDGKTAFLEQVRAALLQRGGVEQQADESGWEIVVGGHTYRSCYDASEAHAGRSANEQLTARLASLEGAYEPAVQLTVLVAINDGRLLDYLDQVQETFPWLAKQIRDAMRAGQSVKRTVWYIDLKQRAFVGLPDAETQSTFQQVLAKLVDPDRWTSCQACAARAVCPLLHNATRLRHPQISQRLETLLLLVHLRRQRHITMRDLRSALAYLITGNRSCTDVHAAYQSADGGAGLIAYHYWQSAFAPLEQADEVLQDLRALDPVRVSLPQLDRFFSARMRAEQGVQRSQLFVPELADDLGPQRFLDVQDWLDALKRRLFFESNDPIINGLTWQQLLPYSYASTFIDLLARVRPLSTTISARIASGIWRSDNVNTELPPGRLNLVIDHSEAQRMIVAKEFSLDDFGLSLQQPQGADVIEAIPEGLVLENRSGTPKLIITLDLFELLMRLADGFNAYTPELQPLLEDLVPFKSSLLLDTAKSLVLIEAGRYRHRLEQHQGRLRLLTDGEHRA